MTVEDPIYVGVLMRMQHPDLELGALFSYGWPILLLVASAVFAFNTVGNVLGTNQANVRRLARVTACCGLLLSLLLVALAFSPLAGLLLRDVMAVPASELEMTQTALKILAPYPAIRAMNALAQGILIRAGHAPQVLAARFVRFAAGLIVLVVGLQTDRVGGAALGAAAIMLSLLAQTIFLWWRARRPIRDLGTGPIDEEIVDLGKLARFAAPLAITPILVSVAGLAMASAIGRLPGVIVSLAVWPVITNFSNIGMMMGGSFKQVTVKHDGSIADRCKLHRFALGLGLGLTAINILFVTLGLFDFALRDMERLAPQTARVSLHAIWFLTPLPFLYTMNAFYCGLLSRSRRTMPILESQMAALLLVVLMVLATVNLDPFTGVYVVSASSVAAKGIKLLWVRTAWRRHERAAVPDARP